MTLVYTLLHHHHIRADREIFDILQELQHRQTDSENRQMANYFDTIVELERQYSRNVKQGKVQEIPPGLLQWLRDGKKKKTISNVVSEN